MTDHERRLVLRGMSIARGLLINTPCTHHGLIKGVPEGAGRGVKDRRRQPRALGRIQAAGS